MAISQFWNPINNKKKAKFAFVAETGTSNFDMCLYYLTSIINNLLIDNYYHELFLNKLEPELVSEYNYKNDQYYYVLELINKNIDIELYKLIDTRSDVFNLCAMEKICMELSWNDISMISQEITLFRKKLGYIKKARHTRHAHLSNKLTPTKFYARSKFPKDLIENGMSILDLFTDGKIPYYLYISDKENVDLREFLLK
jgi:hypothetical protein